MPVGACLPADPPGGDPPTRHPDVGSGISASPAPVAAAPLSPAARDALLAALLRKYHGTVWRTLRRVGIDADRVDDAAQEVFIIVSRKLELIEPGRERNYLLSSALRVAANYRRARRARRELLDDRTLEEQTDPVP